MSLRKDLPKTINNKWSKRDLDIFDNHRKAYKKTVKIAESCYGDRAFIASENSVQYHDCTKLLVMLTESGAKAAQLLLKVDITDGRHLSRAYDVITAFYIPQDVDITIRNNGMILGKFYGDSDEKDLETILQESRSIPTNESDNFLEHILFMARQGKIGFIHNQDKVITIDGIEYHRRICVQPFIPMAALPYANLYIESSQPSTVYLEINCLHTYTRSSFMRDSLICYIEQEKYANPIRIIKGGAVDMPYYPDDWTCEEREIQLPNIDIPIQQLPAWVDDTLNSSLV